MARTETTQELDGLFLLNQIHPLSLVTCLRPLGTHAEITSRNAKFNLGDGMSPPLTYTWRDPAVVLGLRSQVQKSSNRQVGVGRLLEIFGFLFLDFHNENYYRIRISSDP